MLTSETLNTVRSSGDIVEFSCSGFCIRAQFVTDNLNVVQHVKDAFPISTLTDHVLTAGETLLFPFPITYLGKGKSATRLPGTVYCNLGSKALAICYGDVKQAGMVNEIATVLPEDMEKLKAFGKLVKENTQKISPPYLFETVIRMPTDGLPHAVAISPAAERGDGWQCAVQAIKWHTARLNTTKEPDEIKAIRLGAIEKANNDVPSILTASTKYDFSLEQKRGALHEALFGNFNHFTFLSGHGLKELGEMACVYREALGKVETEEQLDDLTAAFRAYLAVSHRWLQRVFPWHLNKDFPKRSVEEVARMPKLQHYSQTIDGKVD